VKPSSFTPVGIQIHSDGHGKDLTIDKENNRKIRGIKIEFG
jgi:hypothetical protein